MGSTKALGEDEFPALFYPRCWDIIGNDVSFSLHLLNGEMEVSPINSTQIVLIPKITNPSNLTHFRPISQCNVIYKIVTKAIANKFRGVIDKCIYEARSAFVLGRLITDNVLVAYGTLYSLKQKKVGKKGYMAVKLDMSKAYDRVEGNFIQEIMSRMGFSQKWIESIMKCMSTVSYLAMVNGLIRIAARGVLKGIKASRSGPRVFHLLFVNGCILFEEATRKRVCAIKQILWEYKNSSAGYSTKDFTEPFSRDRTYRLPEATEGITVQLDVAFDRRNARLTSGIVVRDQMGDLKALKSVLHDNILSPFEQKPSQIRKSSVQDVTFQFIHRMKNTQAHNLAKEALERKEESYLVGEMTVHRVADPEERWRRNPE
ncbi:hypothetical protein PVK06_048751 [Gossypium arboreum]|uniref:Reverse transcriptase domain-containing protein n=1 Tax=Gossypium arboreum TaxID=29729 RepID=A0ABR0MHB2_GOSAR|nr:hypothetical protein PVK06_048751 [Gossypium arboreum]